MQTGEYSYEQVIEFAASIELRGARLYTSAAANLNFEPAKNILLHLAEQEKQHEAYFRSLKKEIEEKGLQTSLDDEAVGYLSALVQSDVFPAEDKDFIQQFKSLKDVLRVSKQAEKDSILFYLELSRYAWDDHSASVLKSITQEEKRHLVQLQELEQLIEERDVYY